MAKESGEHKSMMWVVVLVVVLLIVTGILIAMKRRRAAKVGGYSDGYFGGASNTHELLPAGKGPHTHKVDLDDTGSGVSTTDMGHRHVVENAIDIGLEKDGEVVPGNHTHNVTDYIVDV